MQINYRLFGELGHSHHCYIFFYYLLFFYCLRFRLAPLSVMAFYIYKKLSVSHTYFFSLQILKRNFIFETSLSITSSFNYLVNNDWSNTCSYTIDEPQSESRRRDRKAYWLKGRLAGIEVLTWGSRPGRSPSQPARCGVGHRSSRRGARYP